MTEQEAKALLKSFFGRLSKTGNNYKIPEGILSDDEARAIILLSGILPLGIDASVTPPRSKPRIELVLSSTKTVPPNENAIRMCIDFGTAMSKAWITGSRVRETLPLVLDEGSLASGPQLMVPSVVFVSNSGKVFFGRSAETQHRQEDGRPRFDNLKRMLSDAEIGQDLFHVPLPPGVDPSHSGLTKGDMLLLYLAWLTDRSLIAFTKYVTDGKIEGVADGTFARVVRRRFAIPCFESAVADAKRGGKRAVWAHGVLVDSLKRAQIIADTLHGRWSSLDAAAAFQAISDVRAIPESELPDILTEDDDIREPVAAGASIFQEKSDDNQTVAAFPNARLRYLLVVDAGAGTTDFAMFQVVPPTDTQEAKYSLLSSSVRMTTIAGNEFDSILQRIVLVSCGLHPDIGSPRSSDDFMMIKADLRSQIRDIKRELFQKGESIISLKPNISGRVKVDQVEADPAYQRARQELVEVCESILTSIFNPAFQERLAELGGILNVNVLLTGGSSAVSAIRELGSASINMEKIVCKFWPMAGTPSWINSLERELADLVKGNYTQCAVAIGGSSAHLPNEIQDYDAAVFPQSSPKRQFKIERYPISGS